MKLRNSPGVEISQDDWLKSAIDTLKRIDQQLPTDGLWWDEAHALLKHLGELDAQAES